METKVITTASKVYFTRVINGKEYKITSDRTASTDWHGAYISFDDSLFIKMSMCRQ